MTVATDSAPAPSPAPAPAPSPAPSGEKQVLGEVQRLSDRVRALEGADLEIPSDTPSKAWSPLDLETWG